MARINLFLDLIRIALGLDVRSRVVRRSSYPALVYKYLHPARTDILETGFVRFSQFGALNDPLEFSTVISDQAIAAITERLESLMVGLVVMAFRWGLPARILRKALNDPSWKVHPAWVRFLSLAVVWRIVSKAVAEVETQKDELLKPFKAAVRRALRDGVKDNAILVFSCSEKADSAPMWAHYASNHSGFQIGFDPADAFEFKTARGRIQAAIPARVEYFKRLPRPRGVWGPIKSLAVSKIDGWSYEKEWRFVASPEFMTQSDTPDQQGLPVYLAAINQESIKEITFGYLSSNELILHVQRILKGTGVSYLRMGADGARHLLIGTEPVAMAKTS